MEHLAYPTLALQPITFQEACAFIAEHHRHHIPTIGHRFSLAVNDGTQIVGVIVVGRTVARMAHDDWTCEAVRCCVIEGYKNAASMLYGAAWRATKALGYRKLITYTLQTEPGTSLRAAGFTQVSASAGGSWDRPSRPANDFHPLSAKWRWELAVPGEHPTTPRFRVVASDTGQLALFDELVAF